MLPELRRKVLVDYNGHPFEYPRDRTILHLIEDQAHRTPDRPAIVWEYSLFTYGELSDRATAWAAELHEHGVTRGDIVPIVSDGGPGFPIAILAVLKCAGAFVPMDAAWPTRRLHANLASLAPRLVITTGTSAEQWESPCPAVLVHADLPAVARRSCPGEPPTVDDLIYGYFTSGSTGEPKCALNRHLGLLNRFLYMTRRFGADDDIVLQNSSHVFDSAIWQLLWPLTKGSRTVLPQRAGILDLPRTIDIIEQHAVTMTDFVPAVFNTLVDMLTDDAALVPRLASLRYLLIGGEAINPGAVRTFRSLLPSTRIVNTYGPTEASIGSVFHEVSDLDAEEVPIGRPIDNTYVALLDEHRGLVAPGQTGEIYLGGDCLGAGYLNAADRTAEVFVDNPFPEIPGPTLYRSGDLAYQRDDGLLIFVGRRDQQIKLAGVRIEPGEIEAAVRSHPAVQEAKVIVHGEAHARRLVCCVLGERELTAEVVREHARSLVPEYAVPQSVVFLDRMPLTANGKIDRVELAHVVDQRVNGVSGGSAPGARNGPAPDARGDPAGPPASRAVAIQQIWRDLLPQAAIAIGNGADFYECGGTSLTLQRLAAALQRRFQVRVPLRELAAASTIREQVELLDRSYGPRVPVPSELMIDDVVRARSVVTRRDTRPPNELATILLTGATGFIGLQLLAELLDRTDATIWCLVRACGGSGATGMPQHRMAAALRSIGQTAAMNQVITVAADLDVPRFGLDAARYSALAESVDTVVHSGALVNLLLGYSGLRRTNVLGTTEVLRFVAEGQPKRLHVMSTLPTALSHPSGSHPSGSHPSGPQSPGSQSPGSQSPDYRESAPEVVPVHGYQQSKWAAEKILTEARDRGLPSTIYQLGEVMPHTDTGRSNPHSLLDQLMRACIRTGLRCPTTAATDWTPVDTVSRMVITAMISGYLVDETVGLVRPGVVRIDSLFDLLAEHIALREVSYADFWRAVARGADSGDGDLVRLLGVLPDPGGPADDGLATLFSDGSAHAGTPSVQELARKVGVTWSPVPRQALRTYLRQLTA